MKDQKKSYLPSKMAEPEVCGPQEFGSETLVIKAKADGPETKKIEPRTLDLEKNTEPQERVFNRLTYRPEIDGFRTFAVLPVVLFHFGFSFPGGFAGVDVFFVISGLLIITMILNQMENDKFSPIVFFGRRVRRLFPAFALVAIAVLITGGLLLPNDFFQRLQDDLRYTLLSGANIFYFVESLSSSGDTESTAGAYFQAISQGSSFNSYVSPFLHCWSLAVEEQFYLVMPFLLLVAMRLARRGQNSERQQSTQIRFVFALVTVLFCLSLALSTSFAYVDNSTTTNFGYYMLPTRMWEMLLGGYFAFKRNWGLSATALNWQRETLATIGVGMILASYFAFDENTPWPGIAAMVPCAGSMFFFESQRTGLSVFWGTVFTCSPVVLIGKISYSLYLWHWPVFALMHAYYDRLTCKEVTEGALDIQTAPAPAWARAVGILISLTLAVLSYFFLEKPLRNKKTVRNKRFFPAAFLLWAVLFILTFPTLVTHGPTCDPPEFSDASVLTQYVCGESSDHLDREFQKKLAGHERFQDLFSNRKETHDWFGDAHWPISNEHTQDAWSTVQSQPDHTPNGEAVTLTENADGTVDLLVIGNSHCLALLPRIIDLAKPNNISVTSLCRIAPQNFVNDADLQAGIPIWAHKDFEQIKRIQPKRILHVERWGLYEDPQDTPYKRRDHVISQISTLISLTDEYHFLQQGPEMVFQGQRFVEPLVVLKPLAEGNGGSMSFMQLPENKVIRDTEMLVNTRKWENIVVGNFSANEKFKFRKTERYFLRPSKNSEDEDEIFFFNPLTGRMNYCFDNNHLSYDGAMMIDDVLMSVLLPGYEDCGSPTVMPIKQ